MKMLLILCSSSRLDEVRELIDEHEVQGYSEIADIRGSGETGKHMGTRAWPGTSCMIFAAVESEKAEELIGAVEALCTSCAPDEGMRVMVLPVERMI